MVKLRLAVLLAVLALAASACEKRDRVPSSSGSEGESSSSSAVESGEEEEDPDEEEEDELELPAEEELAGLEELLTGFWTISGTELNYESAGMQEITDMIVVGFGAPGYQAYFGRLDPIYQEDTPDPRGLFVREEGGIDGEMRQMAYYYKIPADNMDWIIYNIFHVQPDRSVETDSLYYHDGYYYRAAGDAGFIGHEPKIRYCEPLNDGKYLIACDYFSVMEQGQLESTHYMVADLQELEGKPQWTFYYLSNQYMNLRSGSLIYDLGEGTAWVVHGTMRQGGDTGYYVELDNEVEVYLGQDNVILRQVGLSPFTSEYYTSDFSGQVGARVSVRGEVSWVGQPQGQVVLNSALAFEE